jgi:hypothetical protein
MDVEFPPFLVADTNALFVTIMIFVRNAKKKWLKNMDIIFLNYMKVKSEIINFLFVFILNKI